MNIRRLMTLALSAALLASACGDDDGGGIFTDETTTTAATTTTTAAPATTAAPQTTTSAPEDDDGIAVYFSIQHRFNVQYPDAWEVEENSFGAVVTFLSPLTSADDPFHENVNVVVEDLGDVEISLDDYVEVALAQLPGMIPDIQLNDQLDDVMGGYPSKIITYTGSQEGFQFTWVQEVALFDGSAYVLTYSGLTDSDDYVTFRPEAIAIFHSFDFNECSAEFAERCRALGSLAEHAPSESVLGGEGVADR